MAAEEIALLLRKIGLKAILDLEKEDPQYKSVCRLCGNRGEPDTARLVMMNALISYRLTGKGEEHWHYFADFFSRRKGNDICEEFIQYIKTSPYLAIGRDIRIKRIRKVCNYDPDIIDLSKTWRDLARLLGSDGEAKTVVFTVKMLNYVYMCCRGVDRALPNDIPIPVDYRVARLTACLGLIKAGPEEALRRREEVQRIWSEIAERSGVPPLHIDTLLWLAGRVVLYGDRSYAVPKEFLDFIKRFCNR
ncbi:MAG: N-glycosylase/DNA lyase [Thermoproteus sp.]